MANEHTVKRADLPQFVVHKVERGESDSNGLTEWRLRGVLNRSGGVDFKFWSWLLIPERDCLTGHFAEITGESLETTFTTSDKEKPEVEHKSLACLGAYHQAYHIWMVEEGPEAWTNGVFAASDAVAENFVGTDGKTYRKLSKARESSAPSSESGSKGGQTWIVEDGWDHEHCEICNVHIDPGDRYFHYADYNAFLCVACYEKYVLTGSIEFALPS